MRIKDVSVDPPIVLAPLAGLTDSAMRRLCRRNGAAMVWTEMVSAEGTVRNSWKTFELLTFHEEERPIAFQLFGSRPESMAEATRRIASLKPDVIDVNAGCPVKKVVKSTSGAALMRDLTLLRDVVQAVLESTTLPVTVKIRSGWDDCSINAPEAAGMLGELGVAAITVHPRTRAQGFKGVSDWSLLPEVKRSCTVPVIGSGDVKTPEDALRMLEETGVDGVMIGRGAVGNPWLFARTAALIATGETPPEPTLAERLRLAIEHLELIVEAKGEHRGVMEMRKHIVAMLKGFPGAVELRRELVIMNGSELVRGRLERALAEEE